MRSRERPTLWTIWDCSGLSEREEEELKETKSMREPQSSFLHLRVIFFDHIIKVIGTHGHD
jgi:hypothetical protein